MTGYDIIGDIHGCAAELEALLNKLGYEQRGGCHKHPERQVIFLGDFIDREPKQKEVINIVRPMIDEGAAKSVMGNHEFNAICFATKHKEHGYVRPHTPKNNDQHEAFTNAYKFGSNEHDEIINWFKTLPVFLDIDGLLAVHACWCNDSIEKISKSLNDDNTLHDHVYMAYADKDSEEYKAIEVLLKGPEYPLPEELHFNDKDGHPRQHARIRWWVGDGANGKEQLEFGGAPLNDNQIDILRNMKLKDVSRTTDKPVFFGHYWLNQEKPTPMSPKAACVDYSVAKGGKLVAYRWNGEDELTEENFVCYKAKKVRW